MFRKSATGFHLVTEHVCIVSVVTHSDSIVAKVGRPRVTEMRTVVCQTVLNLVSDGETLTSLSLVGIAQETGISRNALYRRWRSKEELYSDVLKSMRRPMSDRTEQSARENLIEMATRTLDGGGDKREQRFVRAIVAEARNFPNLYEQYLTDILAPLLLATKLAIRRGKETGEIRTDVDEEILSSVMARFTFSGIAMEALGSPDLASTCRRVIDLIFDGVGPT
jgi:AcrR family transcriptional regulator